MKTDELAITAKLANIDVQDEELKELGAAVTEMLENFTIMSSFDVSGLEPTTHALHRTNVIREDVVAEFADNDSLLSSAPESEDRFIIIPNVL